MTGFSARNTVAVDMSYGGPVVVVDGVGISMIEAAWGRAELTLAEEVHLQGVHLHWAGAKLGDYGWLSLISPAGESSPQSAMSVNDTTFTVETGKGAYYDPAGGALNVEFWDSSGNLVEMAAIASVAGDVVTLATGVKNVHATSAVTRVCLAHHTTLRGTDCIDGGTRFLGTNADWFESENQMTAPIPAGMVLAARFRTVATVGPREFVANFKMRRPVA